MSDEQITKILAEFLNLKFKELHELSDEECEEGIVQDSNLSEIDHSNKRIGGNQYEKVDLT